MKQKESWEVTEPFYTHLADEENEDHAVDIGSSILQM